VVSVPF